MSKDIAIKIENVGKQYRLGVVGTGTLSHDLKRWWTTRILRKEDPYLKIGETNDRATKGNSNYVWALKDINLEIKKGDVVGIIGKNGAGKSTLLKLLSRVTKPTTGSINYNGRIASLLEVGTGFHPEMTGRENIYMNGAIMGMTRAEITTKLDEIIAFAGVERYIDTPVKRYSSGMTVRLGFSIAAHLEPDILVVDEVLAVGDAEFQKKAIGKMQDVSKGGGRTVLFVSHNMAAVKSLCKTGIVLKNGEVSYVSSAEKAIIKYLETNSGEVRNERTWELNSNAPGNQHIRLVNINVKPISGQILDTATGFMLSLKIYNTKINTRIGFNLQLYTQNDILVFTTASQITDKDSKLGYYLIEVKIPPHTLNQGIYKPKIWFGEYGTGLCSLPEDIFNFEIEAKVMVDGINPARLPGVLKPQISFNINHKGT